MNSSFRSDLFCYNCLTLMSFWLIILFVTKGKMRCQTPCDFAFFYLTNINDHLFCQTPKHQESILNIVHMTLRTLEVLFSHLELGKLILFPCRKNTCTHIQDLLLCFLKEWHCRVGFFFFLQDAIFILGWTIPLILTVCVCEWVNKREEANGNV